MTDEGFKLVPDLVKDTRVAEESSEVVPTRLEVDQTKLLRFRDVWQPEAQRLANEITQTIAQQLSQLPIDSEVLLIEIDGFPGISEMVNDFTDRSVAGERIKAFLPQYIRDALASQNIKTEIDYIGNSSRPSQPGTTLMIRLFLRHDDKSYRRDQVRETYSYQSSICQIFVTRIHPEASSPESKPVVKEITPELSPPVLPQDRPNRLRDLLNKLSSIKKRPN